MSDYKMYEVYVPVTGSMRVHVRAEDKERAKQLGYKIAKEMCEDASESIIPNLFTWNVNCDADKTLVIKKGDADE